MIMDKMILMPAEEYKAMMNKKTELGEEERKKKVEKEEEEASDVKLAKFRDSFIRKQDAKRIEDDQTWERLSSRLKPIFATQQADIQEMLKPFPRGQREEAKLVLNLLARLPKVTLSNEQLLVDGHPMGDALPTIVRDIMRNDVRGVESLIQALRRRQRTIPPRLSMETIDDDDTMDSFIPYTPLMLQAEELPPSSSSSSTPRRVTPIKTTPKRSQTPKELKTPMPSTTSVATRTPKVQGTPKAPTPRVQRSPIKTRSKVQRSPVPLETADPPINKSAKKQETFWISY